MGSNVGRIYGVEEKQKATARVVAFSCKGRAFCSSCCGRRMNSTAAHLVDRVFPRVPVRQWVLSLPFPLRFRLAWDGELCEAVLASVIGTLQGFYRAQTGESSGQVGAVTFRQLFGWSPTGSSRRTPKAPWGSTPHPR